MIVYQAFNPITTRFYVGKTTGSLAKRRKRHAYDAAQGSAKSCVFHRAIRKYGIDCFDWCVLAWCSSTKEMNESEKNWISRIKQSGHSLYNMRPGGDGGSFAGIENHNFGREVPDGVRKKISRKLMEHYATRPGTMTGMSGEKSPFFGRNHSEEARRKISTANSGQRRPSMDGAANPSAKSIVCVTTGKVFDTATEASIKYGCDLSSIIKCCQGKRKTTKGRQFQYLTPGVFGWAVAP